MARRHEISTGLLYTWRKQALAGLLQGFAPVQIASDAGMPAPPTLDAQDKVAVEANQSETAHGRGLIEVLWPNGIVVRVDADVDDRALRSVFAALEAR